MRVKMKCDKCKEKNRQIRKLKREIRYHILCRTGDLEFSEYGKKLAKEFDEDYKWI